MRKAEILTIVLAAAAASAAMWVTHRGSATQAAAPAPTTLTVEGTATTTVTPTQAQVRLGVRASAGSAQEAMQKLSSAVSAVAQRIQQSGVDSSQIRTGQLSLFPQYAPGSPGQITGYQADETLTVDRLAVASVGPLIDAAVAAGANQVEGVSFEAPNPAQARDQAYAQAVADATQQANALAQAQHLRVLGIVSINTVSTPSPMPVYAGLAASAPPIYPGQQQESYSVVVKFQLGS
ncbi:MAG: SIMPL domain-containing protein [Firmicutes bacterium]|nr:SIMPL domain-containing protein [Bacillota bacterium]